MSLFRTLVESILKEFLSWNDGKVKKHFKKNPDNPEEQPFLPLLEFAKNIEEKIQSESRFGKYYRRISEMRPNAKSISYYWEAEIVIPYTFKKDGPLAGQHLDICIPLNIRCSNHPANDKNTVDRHILVPNNGYARKSPGPDEYKREFPKEDEKDPDWEFNFEKADKYLATVEKEYNALVGHALEGSDIEVPTGSFQKSKHQIGIYEALDAVNLYPYSKDRFIDEMPEDKLAIKYHYSTNPAYAERNQCLTYFNILQKGKKIIPMTWFTDFINRSDIEKIYKNYVWRKDQKIL